MAVQRRPRFDGAAALHARAPPRRAASRWCTARAPRPDAAGRCLAGASSSAAAARWRHAAFAVPAPARAAASAARASKPGRAPALRRTGADGARARLSARAAGAPPARPGRDLPAAGAARRRGGRAGGDAARCRARRPRLAAPLARPCRARRSRPMCARTASAMSTTRATPTRALPATACASRCCRRCARLSRCRSVRSLPRRAARHRQRALIDEVAQVDLPCAIADGDDLLTRALVGAVAPRGAAPALRRLAARTPRRRARAETLVRPPAGRTAAARRPARWPGRHADCDATAALTRRSSAACRRALAPSAQRLRRTCRPDAGTRCGRAGQALPARDAQWRATQRRRALPARRRHTRRAA